MRDKTRAWLENTQGLIEPSEGERLALLAAGVPANQAIVELGSHTGLSTCWMAAGSRDGNGAHIFAVDPWGKPRPNSQDDPWNLGPDGVLQRFQDNIAGTTQDVFNEDYGDLVTPLRMTSGAAAKVWVAPVGLLFVDAIHEGPAVTADWKAWARHLAPGAVACFHDYGGEAYPGVTEAIDEVVWPSRQWSWLDFTEPSLWQGRCEK
jgi:hypothetical protein